MKKNLISVFSILLCLMMVLTGCSGKSSSNSPYVGTSKQDPEKEIDENIDNLKDAKISVWDGSIADSFSSGTGSQMDPYIIGSAAELAYVSKICAEGHNFNGEFLELNCNINLNGLEWTPIGSYSPHHSTIVSVFTDFEGSFDGNGYFVSNYQITTVDEEASRGYYGLFGHVYSATIENLTVKDFTIRLTDDNYAVGGLVGECYETCFISNCHSISGQIDAYVTETNVNVGGLIGYINASSQDTEPCYTTVIDCSADADLAVHCLTQRKLFHYNDEGKKVWQTRTSYSVGGLISVNWAYESTVLNCYSDGLICVYVDTANDDPKPLGDCSIGGLMGVSFGNSLRNSYSTTTIMIERDFGIDEMGGLLGLCEGTYVENCYAKNKIEVTNQKYQFTCGGLIGRCINSVSNCFVDSTLSWSEKDKQGDFLFGVVDLKRDYTISNCFVTEETRIKTKGPDEKTDYYSSISRNELLKKFFLSTVIGYEEYSSDFVDDFYAVPNYPGWIIKDGEYPRMYYAEEIQEEPEVEINENITSLLGSKAEDAIAKFGTDYTMSDMSLLYSGAQISFALGTYNGTLSGNEQIVAINIAGLRDIGNNLNSSMTYTEIKEAVKEDIAVPTYLEIDGTYILSVEKSNLTYTYTWSTENYDVEKCNYVTISKR